MDFQALAENRTAQWHHIMELSGVLYEHALSGEWDDLARKEAQRKPMLEDFFDNITEAEQSNQLIRDINKMIELNQRIVSLVKANREQLQDKMQAIKVGKRAFKAYNELF